jgi:hypothetical protein
MASFELVLQTSGSLHPHGEPSDFIAEYSGILHEEHIMEMVLPIRDQAIHTPWAGCGMRLRADLRIAVSDWDPVLFSVTVKVKAPASVLV